MFDTNVWGAIISRITPEEVSALRSLLHDCQINLWMAPSTLTELSFRSQPQRLLVAQRAVELAQPDLLQYSSLIVIDEFLMEMFRIDPYVRRAGLILPSLSIESSNPLVAGVGLLTNPSTLVQEAAQREKLIRILNQDRYKTKITLVSEEDATRAIADSNRWYELSLEELRALVPQGPRKSQGGSDGVRARTTGVMPGIPPFWPLLDAHSEERVRSWMDLHCRAGHGQGSTCIPPSVTALTAWIFN